MSDPGSSVDVCLLGESVVVERFDVVVVSVSVGLVGGFVVVVVRVVVVDDLVGGGGGGGGGGSSSASA